MTAILLEDKQSGGRNGHFYGKKGDKVNVFRIEGHMAFVEGKEKFTININQLKFLNDGNKSSTNQQEGLQVDQAGSGR